MGEGELDGLVLVQAGNVGWGRLRGAGGRQDEGEGRERGECD
jgi:hypothetical protein